MPHFNKQDFIATMRDIRENYFVSRTMRQQAINYIRKEDSEAWGKWRDGKMSLNDRLTHNEWAADCIRECETKGNY